MRFACQSCQTKYSIADERVTNKVVRLKCQRCGAEITVRGPVTVAQASNPVAAVKEAGPATLSQVQPISREQSIDALGSAFGEAGDDDPREGATKIASLTELEQIRQAAAKDATKRASEPPPAKVAAPPPVAAPAAKKIDWFVLVKGTQEGPFSETKVKQRIVDGDIGPRTYAWRDGLGDWQRLQLIGEFTACFITDEAELVAAPVVAPPPRAAATPPGPPPIAPARRVEPTPEALSSLLDASIAPVEQKPGSPWTGPHRVDTAEAVGPLDDMFAPAPATGPAKQDWPPPVHDVPLVGSAFSDPDAPPREDTRMFIAAAGLVQRRKRNRQIAMAAGALGVALLTMIVLDVAGLVHIPALGAAYELVGIENPHSDPGQAQYQSNLSEEERERLKQKLMGGKGKEPVQVEKKAGPRPSGAKTEAGADQFADKGKGDGNEQKMLADVFDDQNKTEQKVETPKFKTPESDLPQGLTAEAIGKVVESNQKAVKFCFERAIKRGQQLGGRMEVEFTIAPMGTVSDVTIKTAKIKGTEFGDCVATAVKAWKFPRFNGEPVSVEYPFILSAGI